MLTQKKKKKRAKATGQKVSKNIKCLRIKHATSAHKIAKAQHPEEHTSRALFRPSSRPLPIGVMLILEHAYGPGCPFSKCNHPGSCCFRRGCPDGLDPPNATTLLLVPLRPGLGTLANALHCNVILHAALNPCTTVGPPVPLAF